MNSVRLSLAKQLRMTALCRNWITGDMSLAPWLRVSNICMQQRGFSDRDDVLGNRRDADNDSDDIHENSDLHHIQIPFYKPKQETEDLVRKRARLVWQSRKRGIAENCLLLSTFADKHLKGFDMTQLTMYDDIINKAVNDWQLYYWMLGYKPTPKEFDNEIMTMLKVHCKNEDKVERFEQPVLNYEPVQK